MKSLTTDKYKIGIYLIINTMNNKVYVGKSINIYSRIKYHISALNTKSKNENIHLINAWHKYGRSKFIYKVIEYLSMSDDLDIILSNRELYWMNYYNSLNKDFGYNLRYDSGGKCIVSDDTRKKLSDSQIKRFKNVEERIKMSNIIKNVRKTKSELFDNSYIKIAYAKRNYRIGKFDLNDNLIKIYDIINDILIENPMWYKQAIKSCCSGYKKSYRGFKWHYVNIHNDDVIIKSKI